MLSVERVERSEESAILYDGSLVNHMRAEWFDPATWPDAPAAPGYSGGRGATLFIECEGQQWVLRHYHRGGRIARLAGDGFIWLGEKRNRAFAEWRLLARIRAAGLPAPRPVAARYVRRGMLYRADLITVRIPGVVPLSTRLATRGADAGTWRAVGACVGRFHAAGVRHADLTAHNLQIDADDRVFLLDFDRGRIMPRPGTWQRRNLDRLHRSLTKVSGDGTIRFTAGDWAALEEGYRSTAPSAP
jgi:3-deoxy-D-manno-octulosonic acid kinase